MDPPALEYLLIDTVLQTSDFRSVHKCKLCPYISKSIFFMRNHARRHRLLPKFFSCSESEPETYSCRECGFKTDILKVLSVHINENHHTKPELIEYIPKSYFCKSCNFKTFSTVCWLKHKAKRCHLRIKFTRMYYCRFCSVKSKHLKSLKKHLKTAHYAKFSAEKQIPIEPEKPKNYECQICDFQTEKKRVWHRHASKEHATKFCSDCDFTTPLRTLMRQHRRKIHPIFYTCESCGYEVKEKMYLEKHITLKHSAPKDAQWLQCAFCHYKTLLARSLRRHISRIHPEPESSTNKWFSCVFCRYKTKIEKYMELHVSKKHTQKK